jgi:cell division protease FtsH
MSPAIGPLALLPRDGQGGPFAGGPEIAPETLRAIDDEIRRVVTEAHDEVVKLLAENRDRLDGLAQALLEHETLDEDDAYAAAGVAHTQAVPAEALAMAALSTTPRVVAP